MSVDYSKLQLTSAASSNKIWMEGSGSFTVSALPAAGEAFTSHGIAHNYGSDNLLFQVSTSSRAVTQAMLPWAPGDNRQIQYASLDANLLYITFISTDSSGLGEASFVVEYVFRLLIP